MQGVLAGLLGIGVAVYLNIPEKRDQTAIDLIDSTRIDTTIAKANAYWAAVRENQRTFYGLGQEAAIGAYLILELERVRAYKEYDPDDIRTLADSIANMPGRLERIP